MAGLLLQSRDISLLTERGHLNGYLVAINLSLRWSETLITVALGLGSPLNKLLRFQVNPRKTSIQIVQHLPSS